MLPVLPTEMMVDSIQLVICFVTIFAAFLGCILSVRA